MAARAARLHGFSLPPLPDLMLRKYARAAITRAMATPSPRRSRAPSQVITCPRKTTLSTTITTPITFAEAVLGATITVPTLDGKVSLRVPPGSKSGRVLRAKGKGAAAAGGAGDLLVTLEIDVPTAPTPEQHAAVESLAAATPNPRSRLGV